MTMLPIIDRELRTQARLGFTYHLRVLGAGASLVACVIYGANYSFSAQLGGRLFAYLHFTLLVTIWVLVPLLTADCISRERREGTLGLLFLTPLREREVVLAKGMVHGIRAMSLLLAVLPIITLSFLLGGVSAKEAVISAFINFGSVCLALAAGLLASSVSKSWIRSRLLAGGIAAIFAFIFIVFNGCTVLIAFPAAARAGRSMHEIASVGVQVVADVDACWGQAFSRLSRAYQWKWLMAEAGTMIVSLFGLLICVIIAARNLRRNWQDEPPSARRVWMESKFCQPVVAVGFYRRWMRRRLNSNPIGWLGQRTWTGRSVMWGWLAAMIFFYSVIFAFPNVNYFLGQMQDVLVWSLMGVIAATSAGSFQRERENRVLELLLVSPMSAGDLVWGRLRGLWGQFVPALGLMLFVWNYLALLFRSQEHMNSAGFLCSSMVAIPVIGLYYSLMRLNYLSALLSTLAMALFVPYLVDYSIALLAWIFVSSTPIAFGTSSKFLIVTQMMVAIWLGGNLLRNLEERNFPFAKGGAR